MKTIRLRKNGNPFTPISYHKGDNLEAFILNGEDLIRIYVTQYNDVTIELMSEHSKASKETLDFINSFHEDIADVRMYLIDTYQEYLYPFHHNQELDEDNLVEWFRNDNNVKVGQGIELLFLLSEFPYIRIIKNDKGLLIKDSSTSHDLNKNGFKHICFFKDYETKGDR